MCHIFDEHIVSERKYEALPCCCPSLCIEYVLVSIEYVLVSIEYVLVSIEMCSMWDLTHLYVTHSGRHTGMF